MSDSPSELPDLFVKSHVTVVSELQNFSEPDCRISGTDTYLEIQLPDRSSRFNWEDLREWRWFRKKPGFLTKQAALTAIFSAPNGSEAQAVTLESEKAELMKFAGECEAYIPSRISRLIGTPPKLSAGGEEYGAGVWAIMAHDREHFYRKLASNWKASPDFVKAAVRSFSSIGRDDVADIAWTSFPRFAFYLWNSIGQQQGMELGVEGEPPLVGLADLINQNTYEAIMRMQFKEWTNYFDEFLQLDPDEVLDTTPWWYHERWPYSSYPPRRYFFDDGSSGGAEPGWVPA